MALGNESQKEFWFEVLEFLSQDLGFWSMICVIFHVVLQKCWSTINKKVLYTYLGPKLFTVEHCGLKWDGWQCFWKYILQCVNNFCKVTWEITQIMDQKPKSCERSSSTTNQNSFGDSFLFCPSHLPALLKGGFEKIRQYFYPYLVVRKWIRQGVRYSDHLSLTGILFWVPLFGVKTWIFGHIYANLYTI